MKMIIVDDEIGIANSIKGIFEHNELGIDEICVFDSGADALDRIKRGDIDILMTDIRMPEMDGLELSRYAIGITPEIKIIMCSGYDDFEYAQAAIRIGVMEYLLKPVTIEEVTEAVERAADMLRKESLKNKIKAEYESSLDMYIQNTKNMLSAKLIQKNGVLKSEELKKYFELIKLKDTPRAGCVACIGIMPQGGSGLWDISKDISLLRFGVDNILNEMLEGIGSSFYDGSNCNVVFLFGDSESEYTKTVKNCMESLCDTLGVEFSVGIGSTLEDVSNMYHSYCEALTACRHGAFYKKSGICNIKELKTSYRYPEELERRLLERVSFASAENEETVENVIDKYIDDVASKGNIPISDIKTICSNILIACVKKLQSLNSSGQEPVISKWLEGNSAAETIDELRQNLISSMKQAQELLESSSGDKNRLLVENAKKYIEEHMSEDLSLENVSRIFFFSSRYFARLFKEYTGKSYSDYVNDTKMEIAKQYLANTDFNIGEIARRIGYDDQGHFGRNFKKYTGMKPSEFRKRK